MNLAGLSLSIEELHEQRRIIMSVIRSHIDVPTIDVRERVPEEAIDEFVANVVDAFDPERIILFGSYAEGRPRPTSDVDLLVVMRSTLRSTQQAAAILQAVEHHFGIDLIVIDPKTLDRRAAMGDSFILDILDRGTVLYARPGR